MTDFDELLKVVMGLKRELAEVRHVQANQIKTATVEEVDGTKGYRLKLGEDGEGKPILSPWYPHPEAGGKKHKTWKPLTKGEIVTSIHPSGDARQGFLIRGGFSDQEGFKQPSQNLDEIVEENFRDGDKVQRKLTIDKDGNKSETMKGKSDLIVEKDATVTVKGKSTRTVEGDEVHEIKGSRTVKVAGQTTYETGGINWT
jgi:phage baseplate assembly protein gpV